MLRQPVIGSYSLCQSGHGGSSCLTDALVQLRVEKESEIVEPRYTVIDHTVHDQKLRCWVASPRRVP